MINENILAIRKKLNNKGINKKYLPLILTMFVGLNGSCTNENEFIVTAGPQKICELTNEQKLNIILEKYNLTQEQFDIIVAVVHGEATYNSYEDAYAIINTIYNRTISNKWVSYTESLCGSNTGTNMYYQVICPGQFTVYLDGLYYPYLGVTDTIEYQAVIDFLYTEEIMHNYLSFVGNRGNDRNKQRFAESGNLYYNILPANDRLEKEEFTRVRKW